MQQIDFSQIRIHDGSQNKGFEKLVCQLANLSKPENAKEFIRKDGSGGDAGVECYWKLNDGSEHAWQAKYFLKPLGPTQWKQISDSVKKALDKHPDLTKYYICLPRNRTDSRRSSTSGIQVISELDKWNQHVEKWKEIAAKKSMQVEFEYWGEHEILLMLQRDTDDFASIARYWFGTPIRPTDVYSYRYFPTDIVDQKIKDETEKIRKSRFFGEFNRIGSSLALARKLIEGELSGGTDVVRRQSLAWCVQLLAIDDLCKAESYFARAKELGTCPEIDIAAAFISSRKDDKEAALSTLAGIDSPVSRSAALMVVTHHDGPQEAVDWLKKAGIDATNLDPDGKCFLLARQFELADWEAAQSSLDVLTDDDLRDAPFLHHMVAVTHLLRAVPDELSSDVLNQPPFDAVNFPLASDLAALEAHRAARHCFIKAAEIARKLDCPIAEKTDNEYALWLELRDPDESDTGRKRLESKLRDPTTALNLVRLGVQFGIRLDLDAIEREIERQIALNGKITSDAAIARLALAFMQPTPEDAANYIARHHDTLAEHIDKKYMQFVQIELFARAGQLEQAKKCLDILLEDGLSEGQERRLRGIIAEAEGADPVERHKEQFKETDSLHDLELLVGELEIRNDWDGLSEYGRILFERTHALGDGERLATALHNTQEYEPLAEFLESNKTLLEQSEKLQMLYCLSLYHEGALLEARSKLAELGDDWDDPNYRTLHINLGISLGDWNSVSAFVANECKKKDKRNAQELIGTAQLAVGLDSISHAKELIFAAAEKGKDDADVLGTAYFLATKAGWEDQKVSQWMHKAATISGDDGPIGKMTLRDLLDRKPEWDQRTSKISQRLTRGELPMFLAAQAFNTSLCDLMFLRAWANLAECDPRRRGVVPAYSGQRQPTRLNTDGQVGIDATALLTLSFLNLLDEALDAFDTVHVPHSTLGWLFEEKQRVTFHQPSRIKDAHGVRDLLATGALEELSPSTVPDSDLSDQVGNELALFIAEAEKVRHEDDSQRIVVQSSPVHRVASLMEEEADLTAHATVLSSCQSIVDKLRQKGQITASEEQKARAYLQLREKPWPNQPQIADRAILYLDALSVKYFLHLGILGKLRAAGFRPIISPGMVSEINLLISYAGVSGEVEDAIERIRSTVNSRIESGKIKVSKRINVSQSKERLIYEHPTAGVSFLARHCDAIITDDRFLNQHANIGNGDGPTPIFSTLDLIDALVTTGAIKDEERLEYRTQLRRAGYFFVPVSEDELAHHLDASMVEDDKFVETAELKAIRENILQVRMSTWLQLPKEEPWLKTLLHSCHRALAQMWKANIDFVKARARSEWILCIIDVRGWAHTVGMEGGENIVKSKFGESILSLLSLGIELSPGVRDEYLRWVDERVLAPLKERNPDMFSDLLESYKGHISHVVDKCMKEMTTNEDGS